MTDDDGWTFKSLERYFSDRIENLKTVIDKRSEADERALRLALDTLEKRFERLDNLDKKLFALSELKADKKEGLSARYMTSAILFAALSFLVSLVSMGWGIVHKGG